MIHILKKVPFFSKIDENHLPFLLKIMGNEQYAPHTLLFQEKDPGTTFFIILTGSIRIFTKSDSGEEKILSILHAGDSFGELSLIDGKPRSASAKTLEQTVVLTLKREDFMELLKINFSLTEAILIEICQRLRNTNERVKNHSIF